MVLFEKLKPLNRGFYVGKMHLTQARKQRLFFIGCVLGRSLSEVAQRGFKCDAGPFGQGAIDEQRNSRKSSEQHFDAPVTVRQQTGGIGKVVRLDSNLYRDYRLRLKKHHQRLQIFDGLPYDQGRIIRA
jgi:hypothetical protein